MLYDGIATAFEDGYKEKIDVIDIIDIIDIIDVIVAVSALFLYESGKSIVAYGNSGKDVIKESHNDWSDKTYLQYLNNFTFLKKPMSSKEINKILERKLIPVQTLIRLKNGE